MEYSESVYQNMKNYIDLYVGEDIDGYYKNFFVINDIELTEENKELIIDTYHQLDEQSKHLFWENLTESEKSFRDIYEFCRQHNS